MTNFEDVIKLIGSCKNPKLLEDLMLGLTTPYERKVLERRIEIIKRLIDGETQHEIAQDLRIGVSTVTRGSRELSQGRFKILRNK